jgi:aryl-alcohol dehydrogenase-like predicted oxidoreductase
VYPPREAARRDCGRSPHEPPRWIHLAKKKKATAAQVAIAWLLAQKPWIVPIPGTTKLYRLEENLGAANVELTADDLAEIERNASAITVQGERYPPQLMATTGR